MSDKCAIVTFQRPWDKAPDFVRVYNVKDRVEAVTKAAQKVPMLSFEDIKGIELRKVSNVLH